MTQPTETHDTAAEHALDHLEEEINALEGTSRWGRWLGWSAAVILVAAVIAPIVWMLATPPSSTSARKSYAPAAPLSIDVTEPRGVTLAEPPAHFAWESVAGRFQYLVRVYVRGTSNALVEKVVTAPSLDLTPDERARIPRGAKIVWTVVAQGRDGSTLASGEGSFKVR